MNAWQIIIAGITSIITIGLFINAYFQHKERGMVFSNAWIISSEKERERRKINKKLEYRLVKNVFMGLGVLFLLISFQILTLWTWICWVLGAVAILIIVYAIVQSAKNGHFK